MKAGFLTLFLLTFSTFGFCQSELEEISPAFGLISFPGFMSSQNTNYIGENETGFGIPIIGFPMGNLCVSIKEKFYFGALLGADLGICFPPKEGMQPLGHIRLGGMVGYKFNKNFFVTANHCLLAQASTFSDGSSDDGWIVGSTVHYKRFLIDANKSLGGTVKGGFLKGRMKNNFVEIFPKYVFDMGENSFWAGIQMERIGGYLDAASFPTSSKRITNYSFLVGKLITLD